MSAFNKMCITTGESVNMRLIADYNVDSVDGVQQEWVKVAHKMGRSFCTSYLTYPRFPQD